MRFSKSFCIIVSCIACVLSAAAIAEVVVYSQDVTPLKPTVPLLPACTGGLLAAIARALDTTVEELSGLLPLNTNLPLSASLKRKPRSAPLYETSQQIDVNQEVGNEDLLETVPYDHVEHANNVVEHLEKAGHLSPEEREKLHQFAQTDFQNARLARERAHAVSVNFFSLAMPFLLAPSFAARAQNLSLSNQRPGSASLSSAATTKRRVLSEAPTAQGDDPPLKPDRDPGERALIHLMSQTSLRFLGTLFTPMPYIANKESPTLENTMTGFMKHRNLVEAFCEASEFATKSEPVPTAHVCPLMNVVLAFMACKSEDRFDPNTCPKDGKSKLATWLPEKCKPQFGDYPKDITVATYTPRFDLKDLRKETRDGLLPMTLTDKQVDDEGLDFFFLYRGIQAAGAYTGVVYACGQNEPTEVIIPGWSVTRVVSYKPQGMKAAEDSPAKDVGFLVVLRPTPKEDVTWKTCKIVIAIRGTSNQYEWFLDARMQLEDFITPGAKVHSGFFQITSVVFPALQRAIMDISESCGPDLPLDIVVTGHSLGGGVAQVLSVMLANSYPTALIHSVSFASPNVFNREGVDLYRKTVNGRNFAADLDVVGAMPCDTNRYPHGSYQCDGFIENGGGWALYGKNAALYQFPMVKVMSGVKMEDSVLVVGEAKDHILPVILRIPPALQVGISHVCAYACKFSRYCAGANPSPKDTWQCSQDCPAILRGTSINVPFPL